LKAVGVATGNSSSVQREFSAGLRDRCDIGELSLFSRGGGG
jgi:hypothetical protein